MRALFKRIQKLSREKQSVKKYVLYALGEMVLIVLSLLLAMQLNQLNLNQQAKKLRSSYYKMFIEDYKSDVQQLQFAQKSFQKELSIITAYGVRLNSNKATRDTLIQISRYEFNPNIPPFVRYNSTTFETIKQTGHLGLIDNQIIQQINLLQTLQNEQLIYQNITLESQARLLENYLSNYPLYRGEINQGQLYESLWENINTHQLLLDFNALLTITRSAFNNALFYYEKIEKETQGLLNLIEKKV
jgi:hypothetical protein